MENSLYREELLDHYRHPRNYGVLSDAHVTTEMLHPSCGDQISLSLKIEAGKIHDLRFQGKGCVISQASASLLTERSLGNDLANLEAFTKDDMLALVGIALGPTRLRCALLSLEALHTAIGQYRAL